MEIVLHSLNGIFMVALMAAAGVIMDRRGWFTEESTMLISRIVLNVCLPPCMMVNIISRFDREQLFSMAQGGVLPFFSILICYVLAEILAKVLRIPEIRKGIFINCVAFSSVIFQGLPLGLALFGEEALTYIMIYYMAGTVTFWTIGNHRLAAASGQEMPWLSIRTLKVIFSPPLFGFIAGMFLVMTGIKLPEPIYRAAYYIGSMTTPLAMIFIGIALSRTDWKEIKPDFETLVAIAGRLFLCPMILMLMMPFFSVGEMMGRVFVICAAMPALVNLSILSKAYGGDYKYGAMIVTLTTCGALMVIPFYMWLLY